MMKENEMIFGIRAIIEAIESDKEIDKIILKKDLQSELSHELFEVLRSHPLIQVQRVPLERINKYTRKNHQGAIAFISSTHYQRVEDLVQNIFEEGKDPFFIILDGVTDVRNFGAIARTCECAGVDAIVIPFRGSVSVGADAIK
ncbi:MAG: 23S rRNA (guanosine(2251)-2'-O)-methyltransferase RlmB, partial [Paludibacteraceae bacterium]|nr:23S rRNA (guanosine(2251)-2'-O)-methyltransferase RlmB [Paludibacteraceae bacterium]